MRNRVFIAALLLVCSASVSAQQIYRWVDEKGSVHFGAQPPQGVEAERISAKAPRPSGVAAPAANKASGVMDAKQQEIELQVKNEVAEQEAERKMFCEQTRTNLAQLRNNPRLSYVDEEGKTHILSDEERQQRLNDAEQSVKDFCL
ncbi:hypothetical protein AXE65_12815 [Ventosimonas gracilis]|uniref:DUF4124 domain-containing protein n=1 Tax=Ventosimonas gracilis TaxID=1680762 RepID=A0A139SVF0_9GAMM|nr:DUF4124 domain-containing protein [Ventosimonas gracilis]KXU38553.1 hypothetical protein AXE65_12815 [Ventosimonas gracilis]